MLLPLIASLEEETNWHVLYAALNVFSRIFDSPALKLQQSTINLILEKIEALSEFDGKMGGARVREKVAEICILHQNNEKLAAVLKEMKANEADKDV